MYKLNSQLLNSILKGSKIFMDIGQMKGTYNPTHKSKTFKKNQRKQLKANSRKKFLSL